MPKSLSPLGDGQSHRAALTAHTKGSCPYDQDVLAVTNPECTGCVVSNVSIAFNSTIVSCKPSKAYADSTSSRLASSRSNVRS